MSDTMSPPDAASAAFDTFADPREYYMSFTPSSHNHESPRIEKTTISSPQPQQIRTPASADYTHEPPINGIRSVSRSPTRQSFRSVSTPVGGGGIGSAKSTPNFSPSNRPPQRNFKDLVSRFNHEAQFGERPIIPPTVQDRQRRAREQRSTRLSKPRSPISTSVATRSSNGKLQPRRENPNARVQMSKLDTSVVLSHSHNSAESSTTSPRSSGSSKRKLRIPLFGEVIYGRDDDTSLGYGISGHRTRRGSESELSSPAISNSNSPHVRSRSHAELSASQFSPMPNSINGAVVNSHYRSYSDLTPSQYHSRSPDSDHAITPQPVYPSPAYPSPAWTSSHARPHVNDPITQPQSSRTGQTPSITSSVPRRQVPHRHSSKNYFPSPKAESSDGWSTPSGKENQPTVAQSPLLTLSNYKYDPAAKTPDSNGQTLRAYISAPVPQKSPPLRSSRPRQPVSSASTAASRAKACERFTNRPDPTSTARPRQHKKIPELGRVDFAERRARIERAISLNIEEQEANTRHSRSSSRIRRPSAADSVATDDSTRSATVGVPESVQSHDHDRSRQDLSLIHI